MHEDPDNSPSRPMVSRRNMLVTAGLGSAALLVSTGESAAAADAPAPQWVPVPERARSPKLPPKGYVLDDFGGGIYGVRDASYQWMFAVTRRGVIAMDAPTSFGTRVLDAIAEATTKPVTHVIYSHAHVPDIGAAHLYPDGAHYIAQEETAINLRRANDPRRPVPTRTFRSRMTIDTGGQRLVLRYHGANHQAGNMAVYAPRQRVLAFLDVVFPRWAAPARFGRAPDVPEFFEAYDEILGYDFTTLVAGRHYWYGTRDDVLESKEWAMDVKAACREAIRVVDKAEAIRGVDPNNFWAIAQAYGDALSKKATELMPTHWLTRLGGADTSLAGNCAAMVASLQND